MGKVKPPDVSGSPSRGQLQRQHGIMQDQARIIRELRNKLEIYKSIIRTNKWDREPWILFDSKQHERRNDTRTWTRANPKQFWKWRHHAYKPIGYDNSPDARKQHTAQQLVQHIQQIQLASQHIQRIVTVCPKEQEQPSGRVPPNAGPTTSGRQSKEPQQLGKRARKRLAVLKRH